MTQPPERLKLDISLVRRPFIPAVWPLVKTFLENATMMSEGRYDIGDLYERLTKDPAWFLWVIFEGEEDASPDTIKIIAAVTTTWTYYPQMKTMHGQFLGGERLDEWQDRFCQVMEEWAKDNSCDALEFSGRKGWTRLLDRNGYRPVFVTLQKDLH